MVVLYGARLMVLLLLVFRYRRISKVDLKFPAHVEEDARDLISKLLVKNSESRYSLDEVMQHPFITKHNTPEAIMDAMRPGSSKMMQQ